MAKKQDELVGISLRIREPLRHRIEQAASRRGVSMNSEITDRLTRSLDDDDRTGSPATAALLRAILVEIETAERDSGKAWYEDLETAACAGRLIDKAVRRHHPDPKKTDPEYFQASEAHQAAYEKLWTIEFELKKLGIDVRPIKGRENGLAPLDHDASLNTLEILQAMIERSELGAEAKGDAHSLARKLPELDQEYASATAEFQKAKAPYIQAERRGDERARAVEQFRFNQRFRVRDTDDTSHVSSGKS